ncbi:MAG TPA: sulfite exporter TauE/SafE family protein [Solirubrobacter sp.]
MRIVLAALAALLALPATASAHPLGNFSMNHLTKVSVSSDRLDVTYILDAAEIPTFQKNFDAKAEVARRLKVTVNGAPAPLRAGTPTITYPPGQGGLKTTRVVLPLSATVKDPRDVRVSDGTFPGRVGWKAVVSEPGRGTAVKASAPATDPTNGLRIYPKDLLKSPEDLRDATFTVKPGTGTLDAPGAKKLKGSAAVDGFANILDDGHGVLLLLLVAAFGWGAVHALSPGHGKAMVAAYLVGTRGKPRDAIALGGIVTATHTAGVFALGLITLGLSQYILPEDLFPWLNLLSGVLVVGVGASVLRRHVKKRAAHDHGHTHSHGPGGHHHHHHHGHEHDRRSLLAMGAAAGIIPCPSALVVLLGAISQDQIALGMLLIVAFSAGLAATLTSLGLAVVYARKLPLPGRAMTALPALSAAAIVVVGCVLTAHAIPTLNA